MKTFLRTSLALLAVWPFAVTVPTQAQLIAGPQNNGTPKIDFDATVFNFGKLKHGDVVKHEFTFTNSGATTLQIIDVKPGCGCTTAGAWDKQVEPGKTGKIPLQFNSTGFSGQVGKSAVVTCNDPANTNLILQLSGTVWKPIDVTPAMASFNLLEEFPTNETKTLRIVNNLEEPITLSDLKSTNPAFKTDLKEVKPGREFELLVTAPAPVTNTTAYATISLKTSSTQAPMVSIGAYLIVQQAVTVSPSQITLPAGPLASPTTSYITIRNNSTNLLSISNPAIDIPAVNLKLQEAQPGRLFTIAATFPAGFEAPAGQTLQFTAKTSNPKVPTISVPIVALRSNPGHQVGAVNIQQPGGPQPASPIKQSATFSPPRGGQASPLPATPPKAVAAKTSF
jgi:hypothetical protein